jgi:SAM-dependent methyltransferase
MKLFLEVKKYNFLEQFLVFKNFYINVKFAIVDITLGLIYFFNNPYRICKNYLISKNTSDPHQYGETPLSTMYRIVQEFDIKKDDRILELGSGRGRVCFFLAVYFDFKNVIGIEFVPFFTHAANFIKKIFKIKNIEFIKQDLLDVDFKSFNFDVVYLFGTCMKDDVIKKFLKKNLKNFENKKIITVSYSLNEFDDSFAIQKEIVCSFPWGETSVYFNSSK